MPGAVLSGDEFGGGDAAVTEADLRLTDTETREGACTMSGSLARAATRSGSREVPK